MNREPILVETVQRGTRYSRDELLRFADIGRSTRVSVLASPTSPARSRGAGSAAAPAPLFDGDGPTPADEIATGNPYPRPHIERELRNLLNPDLRAAAVLMLEGQPFAAPGKRDETMLKLASALTRSAPFNPIDDLLEIMRPSLAAIASEPGATLTLEQEEAKARDKLLRAQRDVRRLISAPRAAAATTDECDDDGEPGEASNSPRERVLARLEEPHGSTQLPRRRPSSATRSRMLAAVRSR